MAAGGLAVAIFSRKINRRLGVLLSLALLSIPTALLAVAPNLEVFTALRVVQGLCMLLNLAEASERLAHLRRVDRGAVHLAAIELVVDRVAGLRRDDGLQQVGDLELVAALRDRDEARRLHLVEVGEEIVHRLPCAPCRRRRGRER